MARPIITPEFLSACIKEAEEASGAREYPTYTHEPVTPGFMGGDWYMMKLYCGKYYQFVMTTKQQEDIIKQMIFENCPHEEYEKLVREKYHHQYDNRIHPTLRITHYAKKNYETLRADGAMERFPKKWWCITALHPTQTGEYQFNHTRATHIPDYDMVSSYHTQTEINDYDMVASYPSQMERMYNENTDRDEE